MIGYYLSKSYKQPGHVDLSASNNANFSSHVQMAQIVVEMEGKDKGEWELKYDRLLQQQARQICGAEAMYDKLASLADRLNKSSPLRQEIEELLVAIDNIEVPLA